MNIENFLNNSYNMENIKIIHKLIEYLDDACSIKKKNDKYIIKKNDKKIIFNNSLCYSGSNIQLSVKNLYIYIFLLNTLNDGWLIKKEMDNFIFKKKYQDKIEVLDSNFLLSFLEENLSIPLKN